MKEEVLEAVVEGEVAPLYGLEARLDAGTSWLPSV